MSRGFAAVGLDNPKINENVAAALRACGVYGASMLATSGHRYRKHCIDTRKAHRHMPLIQVDDLKQAIPYGAVPVAVDLIDGAIPLPEYEHPPSAFYIFGAEDATLGDRVLSWCKDVIYIPSNGCMNLAATVNVVLYDRLAKSQKWGQGE
ncbi:MAG TPA: RNA methyltransferase [Alcanivorax sp.]|nr:RNA methyltransferase [Alcanivorax sp.]